MLQEIRHAFRLIVRSPAFTLIAILSLALGIGANAAMFSLADALVLRPLPVTDPNSVMDVSAVHPGTDSGSLTYPDYLDLRKSSKSLDGLVAFQLSTFSMARTKDDVARMRMGMLVSDNFFQVMGVQPVLGRSFLPEETRTTAPEPPVILGHDFWRDQFQSDPQVAGRTVRIAGIDCNVIGVAPEKFTGMDQYVRPSFFIPAAFMQRLTAAEKDPLEDRHTYGWNAEGRLRAGISQATAQSELATLWKALQQEYPGPDRNRNMAVRTQLQARFASDPFDPILATMLMALATLVLLIACANLANLLLTRARGRAREIAVRIALGVSRARLLRQLMIENVVLALIGAVAGLGFGYLGIRFLRNIPIPTDLPIVIAPQLDARVMVVSIIAALVSVIFFGLAPALQSLRTELIPALKSGETSVAGKLKLGGRNVLVAGQVALSIVLLVASGMLLDGVRKMLLSGPGFRTDHLMLMGFDTALVHYKLEQTQTFYRDLAQRAGNLPGVTAVALTSSVPLSPSEVSPRNVVPEGFQLPKGVDADQAFSAAIDEHFLDLLGIPLVSGRGFTPDDKADTPRVAIVNQEFAKRYWPGQDAIGKRFRLDNAQGAWVQVVGVAKTTKYVFLGESPQRFFYLPYRQEKQTAMAILAQTPGDPASLSAPLRDVVRSLDTNLPIFNVRTFSDFYEQRALAPPRMIMQMVGAMGIMGLVLALIGIYGLVSYSVARRTREIGVRIAIGADRSSVLRMVLRQGLMLSLAGIVVGGLASIAVSRLITAGLIGLGSLNLTTFLVVPPAVLVITMAACWFPALKASRIDPIKALRFE